MNFGCSWCVSLGSPVVTKVPTLAGAGGVGFDGGESNTCVGTGAYRKFQDLPLNSAVNLKLLLEN